MEEIIPIGKTWTYVSRVGVTGKLIPLKPCSIGELVQKRAGKGGLRVSKADTESAKDGQDQLAGRFLRGHAGSVAYTLAVEGGAHWDPLLGVDRARYTLDSFQKSYSRGVAPRLRAQFERHPKKQILRFEEAARL